ncbi:DUF4326 domain-containing protein [Burkholderia pseudomallei]|uniref:DUF4326 domain-containing protein n=1 Tax=Burkholderia pseudomallei TaxID=28450 RepID=UPI001AD74C8E|nr:DUF4326 domain-containing protein [Burkholderia pseudomallei]MBO7806119.1 DUF4326 domain-containing protein [Burkholderia pseudomallei]
MKDASKPRLLIALSEGFASPRLLATKLDKLLASLADPEVVLVQDTHSLAQQYFSAKGLPTKSERPTTRMGAKSVVAACTHVVVFWGGGDLTDIIYFARLLRKQARIVPVRITTVRNKDKNEEFDVYIGRGSKWGNPFVIKHGPGGLSRDDVIKKYKEYFEQEIVTDPQARAALLSIRGYRLGCHCKPLPCHGDIIASYLNSYDDGTEDEPNDGAVE